MFGAVALAVRTFLIKYANSWITRLEIEFYTDAAEIDVLINSSFFKTHISILVVFSTMCLRTKPFTEKNRLHALKMR